MGVKLGSPHIAEKLSIEPILHGATKTCHKSPNKKGNYMMGIASSPSNIERPFRGVVEPH